MHLVKTKPSWKKQFCINFWISRLLRNIPKNILKKKLEKKCLFMRLKWHFLAYKLRKIILPIRIYQVFEKISIKRNLSILTIARNEKNMQILASFIEQKSKKDGEILSIIEGFQEVDIIFNSAHNDEIITLFGENQYTIIVENLGLMSCELSNQEISTPGLFYQVSKRFMFENINIVQVLSTYQELGIVLAEKDLEKWVQLMMDR